MMATKAEYRIYVASLSDYNNGELHGRWIDATLGEDHIREEVAAMLRESKYPNIAVDCQGEQSSFDEECGVCDEKCAVPSAEEWAIHDYELGGIKISEWESFETVAELADALETHGDAFAAWWDNETRDSVDVDQFEDEYIGQYDSVTAYVDEMLEETGALAEVPEWLRYHIDSDSIARDMSMGGEIWTADVPNYGGVFMFRNA